MIGIMLVSLYIGTICRFSIQKKNKKTIETIASDWESGYLKIKIKEII